MCGSGLSLRRFRPILRNLRLHIGNLPRHRHYVRMVGRIQRVQCLLLLPQILQLILQCIHVCPGHRISVWRFLRLLRDHGFEERHILLRAIDRLRRGVKLGCKRLQSIRVR